MDEIVILMEQAIARVELANAEGDPILSGWLADAKRVIQNARCPVCGIAASEYAQVLSYEAQGEEAHQG